MSKHLLHNTDDAFRQAFSQWEAPHSPGEMNADWNQLSKHLPQAPTPHSPGTGSAGAGIGKLATWIGGAAAVLTGTAVVLYNIYVKNEAPRQLNTPQTTVNTTPAKEVSPALNGSGKAVSDASPSISAPSKAEKTKGSVQKQGPDKTSASPNPETPRPYTAVDALTSGIHPNNDIAAEKRDDGKTQSLSTLLNMPPSYICLGQSIALNTTEDISNARLNWGDGAVNNLKPENFHAYSKPGQYTVRVSKGNDHAEKVVNVVEKPEPHFNYFQYENLNVKFRNLSSDANTYLWNFGDGSSLSTLNEHIYPDTGRYRVGLIASNKAGCPDTNWQIVHVTRMIRPERQNVLTPNGDMQNDELILDVPNSTYYHLVIIDNHGKLVFETYDQKIHWNGMSIDGSAAPNGTYFYLLEYKQQNNESLQQETQTIDLRR